MGDWVGAVEVVHELLLVVVDEVYCSIVALGYVQRLELAAANATKSKPDQDAAIKAAILNQVHDRAKRVSFHHIVAQGNTHHQAIWIVRCHLAEGRRFTTTYLD